MKIKQLILLMFIAFSIAWLPANSEAALTFSGTVDWSLSSTDSSYYDNYNGYKFAFGDSVNGLVEFDAATGNTTKLWVDVQKQDNTTYHFESFGSGVYNYNVYVANAHVFEITDSTSGTLNNLVLSNLSDGSAGTWYFDVDNGTTPFRIGGVSHVTPTPVPAAAWLLGSGLAGLIGLRRRKNNAA